MYQAVVQDWLCVPVLDCEWVPGPCRPRVYNGSALVWTTTGTLLPAGTLPVPATSPLKVVTEVPETETVTFVFRLGQTASQILVQGDTLSRLGSHLEVARRPP